jgi:hemerythrin
MTIVWKDSYKVGEAVIDEQHERLFELANKILATEDMATQALCAMQFAQYTRDHFAYEEALMREVNFPDYAGHVIWHKQLITRLKLASEFIEKGTLDKQDLEGFITDWAMQHIPVHDAQLATYITARRAAA